MQTMIREFSKITQLKFGSTEKLRNLPNIPQLLWKDRWVRQLAYDHTVHNRKHREIRSPESRWLGFLYSAFGN